MRRTTGPLLIAAALCLATAACSTSGTPTAATSATATEVSATAGPRCPLDASDLSTATGLVFDLADVREDHELETRPEVKALTCVYTSAATPQEAGDPLVLRVDTVTGADAAVVRAGFESGCADGGGTLADSTVTGAKTCTRGGNTVEGDIAAGDRTVEVYFVNATAGTAVTLTRAFDKVLASVS
ncbi:hypothetical protein [Umezawaea sp.]|uniref:hypothetical protein n=1 Tax=Umezawaea sp. TaxID=1955258 RepID=UPI002ED4A89A